MFHDVAESSRIMRFHVPSFIKGLYNFGYLQITNLQFAVTDKSNLANNQLSVLVICKTPIFDFGYLANNQFSVLVIYK